MLLLKRIKNWYRRELFIPSTLGIFVNPYFLSKRPLAKRFQEILPQLTGVALDFGCGSKPYRELCVNVTKYVGVDIENAGHSHAREQVDFFYDGNTLPFDDETFDACLASDVLEHLFDPDLSLREIARVLKEGGRLILNTPFIWVEHEAPTDASRYTRYGMRYHLEAAGFSVERVETVVGSIEIVMQLFIEYIRKLYYSKYIALNALGDLVLVAPLTLVGVILGKILPLNTTMYGTLVVVAKKNAAITS